MTTWILPDENLVKQHNKLPLIHVHKPVAVSQRQFWWLSWYSNWSFWSPTWCTGTFAKTIYDSFFKFYYQLQGWKGESRQKILLGSWNSPSVSTTAKPTWNFSFSPELWWKLFSNKKKFPWWTNKLNTRRHLSTWIFVRCT